jgi:hypothetical protein
MLQRYGLVMVMMKVLVMMVMKMMISMKPSSMAMMMTMATISPLWRGISLGDFCLPKSFLSLCVFHPAEAAESISDPSQS